MTAFFRAAAIAALLLFNGMPTSNAEAQEASVICENQTYALCASAKAFVFQEVSYAKCIVKRGDSISAPPLVYNAKQGKNVCDYNATGAANGFMASTFSLPEEVRRGGPKALYTCPGGSTGDYAQCDGGTCFDSTRGQLFPGVGRLTNDEIMCSCPITKTSTSTAPFGYQFVGSYANGQCNPAEFNVCNKKAKNGDIIPVGSPPGAGRILAQKLYGRNFALNECRMD